MIRSGLSVAERISELIEAELAEAEAGNDAVLRRSADEMRQVLRKPREVTVNFSGGMTQKCWSVTRGDGDYRVIYMPVAGYFSLCVESDFGPLDIGVHGSALGCFGSV
ncbi:hypothetical protein [uncultured Roseobacter sp.]|uniref:hypothetical protein n=1 Tax=uncultured Roseobacter sp. TaxID=114847 RepID=UPI00262879D5|nr:hypothetical protein [uncultured Roseobacter sp.]